MNYSLKNNGNLRDLYAFEISQAPENWTINMYYSNNLDEPIEYIDRIFSLDGEETLYFTIEIVAPGINVAIACLIAIINYLKLDASAEAHKTTAHQYDKLLTSVEFTSGEVLLFHDSELDKYAEDEIKDPKAYLLGFNENIEGKNNDELVIEAKKKHSQRVRDAKKELNKQMRTCIMEVRNKIAEIKETHL